MINRKLLLTLMTLCLSCQAPRLTPNRQIAEGHLLSKQRIINNQTKTSVNPWGTKERVIWFYDSCAIAENLRLNITDSFGGSGSMNMVVTNYTFADFRTQTYYTISSFSDTTIENIRYKRIKGITTLDSNKSMNIVGYIDYKKRGLLLLKEPVLSQKLNCSILRLEYSMPSDSITHLAEYEYSSFKLTEQERSVFLSIKEKIKYLNK